MAAVMYPSHGASRWLKIHFVTARDSTRFDDMADDTIVLRTYGNEVEAQLDVAILEANGIPAQAFADTAGGALPSIAMFYPVRLLVRAADADLARRILDTPVETTPDDGP